VAISRKLKIGQKLNPKLNFKQYGRTQGLNFLIFKEIATFVRKKMYKNIEKNREKKSVL
jgi:hypothetical protein